VWERVSRESGIRRKICGGDLIKGGVGLGGRAGRELKALQLMALKPSATSEREIPTVLKRGGKERKKIFFTEELRPGTEKHWEVCRNGGEGGGTAWRMVGVVKATSKAEGGKVHVESPKVE